MISRKKSRGQIDVKITIKYDATHSTSHRKTSDQGYDIWVVQQQNWQKVEELLVGDIIKFDRFSPFPGDILVLDIVGYPQIMDKKIKTKIIPTKSISQPICDILFSPPKQPFSITIKSTITKDAFNGEIQMDENEKIIVGNEQFATAESEIQGYTEHIIGILLEKETTQTRLTNAKYKHITYYYEKTNNYINETGLGGIMGNIGVIFVDDKIFKFKTKGFSPVVSIDNQLICSRVFADNLSQKMREDPAKYFPWFFAASIYGIENRGSCDILKWAGFYFKITWSTQKSCASELKITVEALFQADHVATFTILRSERSFPYRKYLLKFEVNQQLHVQQEKHFLLNLKKVYKACHYSASNPAPQSCFEIYFQSLSSKQQGIDLMQGSESIGMLHGWFWTSVGTPSLHSSVEADVMFPIDYIREEEDILLLIYSKSNIHSLKSKAVHSQIIANEEIFEIQMRSGEDSPIYPVDMDANKPFGVYLNFTPNGEEESEGNITISESLTSFLLSASFILLPDVKNVEWLKKLLQVFSEGLARSKKKKKILSISRAYFGEINKVADVSVAFNSSDPLILSESTFAIARWHDFKNLPIESKKAPLSSKDKYVMNLSNRNLSKIPTYKLKRLLKDTLTDLDLSNNAFEYLPSELASLKNLKYVNLSNNPLSSIPAPFRTWSKLQKYLSSIQNAARHWNRCKLLVVGQENVGKVMSFSTSFFLQH